MRNLNAPRGTCVSCGRYVTVYTRKDESTLRARAHSSFHGEIGTERVWKECQGSCQPVTS